jgi:hypothetical protein
MTQRVYVLFSLHFLYQPTFPVPFVLRESAIVSWWLEQPYIFLPKTYKYKAR